jgi:hypothetical protein
VEKLNQWLTLFANLGVLVGIVFLAYELRQTTDTLAAQSILELNLATNAEMSLIAGDESMAEIELKAKNGIGELSPVELERYKWSWFASFNTYETAYLFYVKGLISEQEYNTYYEATCRSLTSPGIVDLLKTGGISFNGGFKRILATCDENAEDLFRTSPD